MLVQDYLNHSNYVIELSSYINPDLFNTEKFCFVFIEQMSRLLEIVDVVHYLSVWKMS